MAFRLTLFGTLQATLDGEPLPIRGDIPRAIVARLGVEPGEILTAEQLVAELWDDPPPTVLSSLRAHISRLRGGGWDAVLGGGRRGYSLDVEPDAIDVVAYRRLATGEAGGSGGARSDDLAAAEKLWRGTPFAGLTEFPFVAPRVEQLETLRRLALLELGRAQLERGDHGSVPQTLAPVLEARPDDPELLGLFVRSLARAGRTAEALDALDAHRARVVEQLGLEPAPELAELRQSIVRQDPVVVSAALGTTPAVERVGVPIPLTRFVGRARELELIERGRAEARLVTLVGPAGVGKTRLAIEAARRTTSAVDDEQWLVDLAVVEEADRVIAGIADVLGVMEHSAAQLAERLRGRRALLILDNAEHVLGAVAAVVSQLLAHCEGLTVLVTSREALRMPGERLVAIDPLVGEAAPDAVRLFLQRATDTSGVVDWDDADLETATALCAALDGLPLALELAASRLDVLTLPEVAASVAHPGRAGGGRHDSITDALDWSIDLLSEAELAALRQLALFAGSFSLDAVAAVVAVDGSDARELTVALTRKSLVAAVASETGVRRFRLLESVQRYVRERHPEPDRAAWESRREAWAVQLVEEAELGLKSPDNRRATALLAESRPDLDAALEGAIERGDRATALGIVGPQAWHWYQRSHHVDGRSALERSLELPGTRHALHEAQALKALAFISSVGADPASTVAAVMRVAENVGPDTDPYHRMMSALMTGFIAAVSGDLDTALAQLDAAAAIRDAPEQKVEEWDRGDEVLFRGDILRMAGRPAEALDYLADSYRRAVETGNAFSLKSACFVTGQILTESKRGREALAIIRTGAVRALETEDWPTAISGVLNFGSALSSLERHSDAAELFAAGDQLGARFGFAPHNINPTHTQKYRERTRAALNDDEWNAAAARGARHGMRSVVRRLSELA